MDTPLESERALNALPRIVIGPALPIRGDILFVSTDDKGTPGALNSAVLRQLGVPLQFLEQVSQSQRGFAEIRAGKKREVVAVVTVNAEAATEINLRNNLIRAVRQLFPGRPQERGVEVWLPLMGTGAGGLSAEESFSITLDVLHKTFERWFPHVALLYISCDKATSDREVGDFIQRARRIFSNSSVLVQGRDEAAELGRVGPSIPRESIRRETPTADLQRARSVRDDSRTHVDATVGRPGMGFERIAECLVKVVLDVVQSASPEQPNLPATLRNIREAWLTVGIFAPWGAGKSTLIEELARQFRRFGHLVITINPWRWDGRGDLHDYVREQVEKQFSVHGSTWLLWTFRLRRLRRRYQRHFWVLLIAASTAMFVGPKILQIVSAKADGAAIDWEGLLKSFGLTAITPFAVWAIPKGGNAAWELLKSWFGNASQTDRETSVGAAGLSTVYQDISKLLVRENEGVRPFVFFFDDLDRCGPERISLVLESVHSLTATGCVVFIACDDEYVAAAINTHYEKIASAYANGADFGRRFLEKIVQISFRIPLMRASSIFELGIATKHAPDTNLESANAGSASITAAGSIPSSTSDRLNIGLPSGDNSSSAVDELTLSQIVGDLLEDAVEPLGLNLRQVKSVANTLKLYLGITQVSTEEQARQLAAFVFAEKFDPNWLDRLYDGTERNSTLIGSVTALDRSLSTLIGDKRDEMLTLYHLVGRRPKGRG